MSISRSNTVMVFPFDLMSHYLRCITLANEYRRYEVLFQSSASYNDHVRAAGFEVFEAEQFDPVRVMRDVEKFKFNWLNRKDIERVFLSQVKMLDQFRPAFVIGDTSPTLKMACEATDTKFISLMNGYMTKYCTVPKAISSSHFLYRPLEMLLKNIGEDWAKRGEDVVFSYIHKPFKRIRKKYGLKQQNTYLDELEGDENLLCDLDELFPQKALPSHYRFIGPLMHKSSDAEEELMRALSNGKPVVCVSMGSTGKWSDLNFLSDNKYSKYTIVTAGDTTRVITGDHVISTDFVNLDVVLSKCRYLICHGGNGTIYHAIKHKVPALCIPAHFEQEWNAGQVEKLGYGKWIRGNVREGIRAYLQ